MYSPFKEYFGRRIVLIDSNGEEKRGILIDKDETRKRMPFVRRGGSG